MSGDPLLTLVDLRGTPRPVAADLPRPALGGAEPTAVVRDIVADVAARGDEALRHYTEALDGAQIDAIDVPRAEWTAAAAAVAPDVLTALEASAARIEAYSRAQVPGPRRHESDGVVIDERWAPVSRAGCYVPGGRASYPSTVLMTAVIARAAGVDEVVVAVPPDRSGAVAPTTLAACHIAEVDAVYRVGGAQAIAALAHGTESVTAADVIVGPGNVYVALAKREVAGLVGVPAAFAGPSEIAVVADASTDPKFAAVDLVVQAEHGPDGLAWLIAWSTDVVDAIQSEVDAVVAAAPRRAEIESTLAAGGRVALVDGPDAAMAVANALAPEHLELLCADAPALAAGVVNAGAIFCGPLTPASIGDYAAGPSHVLPTFGSARWSSALSVYDFLRQHHVVTVDEQGFQVVGPIVETLAEAEGLDVHAESIRVRGR